MNRTLLRVLIVMLLLATAGIHWVLPAIHPLVVPGELTEGPIRIPHDLLHTLFNLNGMGYLVLAALVIGWLPLTPMYERRLYIIIIGYSGLTILAWVVLADSPGWIDYTDKTIEALLVILSAYHLTRMQAV